MKLLIDAQLPKKMSKWFIDQGFDTIHTLDLPEGNRTTDEQIRHVADHDGRIVVTKDEDFVDSHLLQGSPHKLLLISTGNISNRELETLVVPLIAAIDREFRTAFFLALTNSFGLIVRS